MILISHNNGDTGSVILLNNAKKEFETAIEILSNDSI